jgi:hypothetical protein
LSKFIPYKYNNLSLDKRIRIMLLNKVEIRFFIQNSGYFNNKTTSYVAKS